MQTVLSEFELAIIHFLRAAELAQFYQHSPEQIENIQVIKRAVARVRQQLKTPRQPAS